MDDLDAEIEDGLILQESHMDEYSPTPGAGGKKRLNSSSITNKKMVNMDNNNNNNNKKIVSSPSKLPPAGLLTIAAIQARNSIAKLQQQTQQ